MPGLGKGSILRHTLEYTHTSKGLPPNCHLSDEWEEGVSRE